MADVFLARDRCSTARSRSRCCSPSSPRTRRSSSASGARRRRRPTSTTPTSSASTTGARQHGTYFIVMEYVDGRTLAEIIRTEGPLHPDRAAEIAAEVAAALGFAHRNGVVHRDVKPGNVLISPDRAGEGRRLRHRPRACDVADEDLTQAGSVMGTATYFSPEQAQGLAGRRPQRPLLARHRALRDGRRPAAVHRRQPGGDRVQARAGARRPVRRSIAVGMPERPRGHHRQAAREEPRRPLPVGRRPAHRPAPVPRRRHAQRARSRSTGARSPAPPRRRRRRCHGRRGPGRPRRDDRARSRRPRAHLPATTPSTTTRKRISRVAPGCSSGSWSRCSWSPACWRSGWSAA